MARKYRTYPVCDVVSDEPLALVTVLHRDKRVVVPCYGTDYSQHYGAPTVWWLGYPEEGEPTPWRTYWFYGAKAFSAGYGTWPIVMRVGTDVVQAIVLPPLIPLEFSWPDWPRYRLVPVGKGDPLPIVGYGQEDGNYYYIAVGGQRWWVMSATRLNKVMLEAE